MINQEKRSKALSEVKPVQGCAMQSMWGGSFWNLSVFLTKCVKKFPDLMLSINLEYFLTKNEIQNSIIISPPEIKLLPVMTAFNPLMHNVPKWSDIL